MVARMEERASHSGNYRDDARRAAASFLPRVLSVAIADRCLV
jgi:hypothetical protein